MVEETANNTSLVHSVDIVILEGAHIFKLKTDKSFIKAIQSL
jgi:hypothetical protein